MYRQTVYSVSLELVLMHVLALLSAIYLLGLFRCAAKQLPQLSTIVMELSLDGNGLDWVGMAELALALDHFAMLGVACACLPWDRLAWLALAWLDMAWVRLAWLDMAWDRFAWHGLIWLCQA